MKYSMIFTGLAIMGFVTLLGCQPEAVKLPVGPPASFTGEFNPTGLAIGSEVGMLAPEISASDLDGVPFKLSDYRGKVVMLDFYGDW